MTPINIQISRSRSKVKPILDKLGKGGISVSQTSIFHLAQWAKIFLSPNVKMYYESMTNKQYVLQFYSTLELFPCDIEQYKCD